MERLEGEARDRVRATSMWFVAGLVVLGVALGIWAIYVGFLQVVPVPSEVVSVAEDGRSVTVQFAHGSCQEPAGVDVEETTDAVVLTARVSERNPLRGRACTAEGGVARETVVLDQPLGERTLTTATP